MSGTIHAGDIEVARALSELPASLTDVLITVRGLVGSHVQGGYAAEEDMRTPPVLQYHRWLTDDLSPPGAAHDAARDRHLYASGWFRLATIITQRLLVEEPQTIQPEYALAAGVLQHLADEQLAMVLPAKSELRPLVNSLLRDGAHALALRRSRARWLPTGPQAATGGPGMQWAPMTTLSLAALHAAHRLDLAHVVKSVVARSNDAFQLWAEISDLRRDAQRGVETRPLQMLTDAATLPLRPGDLLSTFVGTGTAHHLLKEARSDLNEAVEMAEQAGLDRFAAGVHSAAAVFASLEDDINSAARLARALPPTSDATAETAASAQATAALAYLRSDPELRESWDVYRNGFLGVPESTGRPFPMGFVLDNLHATGVDVTAQVRTVLDIYQDNCGDYFDGPRRLPRDVDTLGLMLRLRSQLPDAAPGLDTLLLQPIHLAAQSLQHNGALPVWLDQTTPAGGRRALLGRSCSTCRASFLLGVALLERAGLQESWHVELLDTAAVHLAEDLTRLGTGGTVYYDPLYLLWTVSELAIALEARATATHDIRLRSRAAQLRHAIGPLLQRQSLRPLITPQQAALLMLTHSRPQQDEEAVPPRTLSWKAAVIRNQRPDGGWDAEPLYWIPNPSHPGAWYSSRTTTTSLCYRALVTQEQSP
ncbi:hypothetical protein K4749_40415 [Streptomyces sp. TRM72054]|uniref:hypothetical protein n=1 Tax=Streptomyces sp. TRM72054 TaxID=2870562 RepID=UPI001C8CBA37|nr:hypothetical protein [Streptomyces sp. TRM72054]MBX9399606.1 hypothetical protein [Streptomyces sp. TRM72054]